MKTLLISISVLGLIAFGGARPSEAAGPADGKARYAQAIALLSQDPEAAALEMQRLAEDGYPRALDRLAYFHVKGTGVAPDTGKAIAYYRRAVESGNERSLVSLGKLLIREGEAGAALDALERARDADVRGAAATLAWGHATGGFGPASQPDAGWSTLVGFAMTGERTAEFAVMGVLSKKQRQLSDPTQLLESLTQRADEGDGKAAEVLLRFYRMVGHPLGSLAERERLLAHEGIRARVAAEEGLYLARETEPARFWIASERIVGQAPDDAFARALIITSKINKNAYVRILQQELDHLGHKPGRASGYLTARTIRAFNAFCREAGITDVCVYGPAKSVAIKAVSAELARARAARGEALPLVGAAYPKG